MDSDTLIVGLGNPGPKYEHTRHNFGFMVVDALLALGETRKSMRLKKLDESGDYELWKAAYGGKPCFFCKPMTYMNLSGKAVGRICGRHGISAENVVVMHDELDLPLGRIKLKKGGGNNGHNGLEDIQQRLNTPDFWRIRLGIGRPPSERPDVSGWVLDDFPQESAETVDETVKATLKGLDLYLRRGHGMAQQFLHRFRPDSESDNEVMDSGRQMG
ncbi:aminoacyl-tRNA hydrolase [Desulfovibrio oxyclinae]|uniref:aminoacyl-tRNA hydrolase n=1 Tax=Desulfovibrio oxyclinae TaxID=63560 RepID=UPI000381144B|nr:aminoacyl-tRNA hydrolase [Desulfovibrio oxyclinae]